MQRRLRWIAALRLVVALVACAQLGGVRPIHGAEAAPDAGPWKVKTPPAEQLNQAADDPTASLMSLQVADWYTATFHKAPGADANTVVVRPVLPFRTGPLHHIFRATVPFITHNPVLDAGLSDIALSDLIVFNRRWGRWGFGPVALFPSGGSRIGADKWALGPAIGFTARTNRLLWGILNQNLFSFAGDGARPDVNASVLQPILNLRLGNKWTIGASEMLGAYDSTAGRWSSLPLGLKLAKLVRVSVLRVQVSAQYEHDFVDDRVGPANTLRFGLKALFPKW